MILKKENSKFPESRNLTTEILDIVCSPRKKSRKALRPLIFRLLKSNWARRCQKGLNYSDPQQVIVGLREQIDKLSQPSYEVEKMRTELQAANKQIVGFQNRKVEMGGDDLMALIPLAEMRYRKKLIALLETL